MEEDGRVIIFGSHAKPKCCANWNRGWADVWEVRHLNTFYPPSLTKIHKRYKDKANGIIYFKQGGIPIHNPGSAPNILASPEDFKGHWNSSYLSCDIQELAYGVPYCGNNYRGNNGGMDELFKTDIPDNVSQNEIEQLALHTFPNPAREVLNVTIRGLNDHDISTVNTLQISNATGQIIQEVSITNSQVSINTSDLNEGLYFIRLITEDGLFSVKQFIKL